MPVFKKIIMRFFTLLFFLLCTQFAYTQTHTLEIEVTDNTRQPLPGAVVQLQQTGNSRLLSDVCDPEGLARFRDLQQGSYLLTISYLGYKSHADTIAVPQPAKKLVVRMEEEALGLQEVTVTATRPLITQDGDMQVVDPEPIANSSTSTLEVLEKTPGLFVDQDGYIFLNSATPAVVYINGREQRLSPQDIASILRSLPPSNIQKIEILRTPSSKYDASSSGGIVNVVLKKGVKIGRTGSVNAGFNQGRYGNQFAGFNLNDSGEKGAWYLNGNLSRRDLLEEVDASRQLADNNILLQQARSRQPGDQLFTGIGGNLDFRQKLSLSYDGRLNLNRADNSSLNLNRLEDDRPVVLSQSDNLTRNQTVFANLQHDLGANYKIDSLGSSWDTKLSFNTSNNYLEQDYSILFFRPRAGSLLGEGDNEQVRRFFLLQSDLILQLPADIKAETGFKTTFQRYRSEADYFFRTGDSLLVDPLRTNAFSYREQIHAAYLQASKGLPGKLLLKAGVRWEYTFMDGRQQIPADTSFVISRNDFFPYVFLSRPVVKIADFELRAFLIYRKSINRPGYQSLNPYIKYVDPYLYETGNPALQPQFTDNVEFNISFDERPIIAVGRNYISDIFSNVVYQDSRDPEVAVRTLDNVGRNRETYLRLIAAIPPGGVYFFVVGAQYNLSEYDGLYENQPLQFRQGSWRFFTYHQLKLGPNTKLSLNGFMLYKGLQNFYQLDNFGQLNMSVNQTFMNNKLNVNISANDIFRTMLTRFSLEQGSIETFGSRYSDNQRFGMNIRYQFGLKTKEERTNMLEGPAE